MSKTARSISISLLALLVASAAAAAPEGDTQGAAPRQARVIGYLPAADPDVDAALRRGLHEALAAAEARGRVVLRVGGRPAAWSNAAPQAVALAFGAGADVLVTPPDRRVAHLMAQVATRTQVPMVSTSTSRSVGATGSTWVVSVFRDAQPPPADAEAWEAVGSRAGHRALELLDLLER